jgi:hypothetical protein
MTLLFFLSRTSVNKFFVEQKADIWRFVKTIGWLIICIPLAIGFAYGIYAIASSALSVASLLSSAPAWAAIIIILLVLILIKLYSEKR